MTLAAGARLGPYEILAPLGAGGMGEVYRARDSRLGRDVAVKVLPTHLADDPELRTRFEREARAVSSLNHPHICVLHDVGHEGGVDYLVMELVEGETLADRIARGPLPPAEVLRIGTEIADALDRAHRSGVVHRDLKPGNIMLTKSGAKLMDFGLARAAGLSPAPGSLSQSPTMTRPLTTEGALVGTFQYMSPEQVEGREADARSDLWALGATLYEMASGRPAFAGRSQASLIASIMKEEPRSLAEAAPLNPPALDRVIRACLAKDPEERIQTAHDVKLQLQWIREGGSLAGVPAPVAARRRVRERTAWVIAGVAIAAAATLGTLKLLERHEAPRVMRFDIVAPPGTIAITWPRVSPDGRLLAFQGSDTTGIVRVWVRPLSAIEAHPLPGTEGAGRPFWSPDSRFLAYIAEGKLRKVPVDGGPPVTLSDAHGGFDGTWGSRDVILFDGASGDSIRGAPGSGGDVRPYTSLAATRHATEQGWPSFMSDGRHFLFVAYGADRNSGMMYIGKLGTFEARPVGTTDGRVEYDPLGWLVFVREGTLLAQRLDPGSFKTIGDPVPIAENVSQPGGATDFSATSPGVLAYRTTQQGGGSRLVWYDRSGKVLGDEGSPDQYRDVAISPDGTRLALSITDHQRGKMDIWVRQLARGTTSRLTFEETDEFNPVWSPDGQRIAYATNHSGDFHVGIRASNGLGVEDTLKGLPIGATGPTNWSRDGSRLLVRTFTAGGNWDVWMASPENAAPPHQVVATQFNDQWARFSPNGQWIAYQSSESGRPEIYVQSANGGGKWQVSTRGGVQAHWRADGAELFYQGLDQMLMAVPISAGATFEAGTPTQLFRVELPATALGAIQWYPSADGKKFIVITPLRGGERPHFTIVTNWASELAKK